MPVYQNDGKIDRSSHTALEVTVAVPVQMLPDVGVGQPLFPRPGQTLKLPRHWVEPDVDFVHNVSWTRDVQRRSIVSARVILSFLPRDYPGKHARQFRHCEVV